jgi:hypothetical protein
LPGTAFKKFIESAVAFMADLMGPIYPIFPGTFSENFERENSPFSPALMVKVKRFFIQNFVN